jgi:hypothetical protein
VARFHSISATMTTTIVMRVKRIGRDWVLAATHMASTSRTMATPSVTKSRGTRASYQCVRRTDDPFTYTLMFFSHSLSPVRSPAPPIASSSTHRASAASSSPCTASIRASTAWMWSAGAW